MRARACVCLCVCACVCAPCTGCVRVRMIYVKQIIIVFGQIVNNSGGIVVNNNDVTKKKVIKSLYANKWVIKNENILGVVVCSQLLLLILILLPRCLFCIL